MRTSSTMPMTSSSSANEADEDEDRRCSGAKQHEAMDRCVPPTERFAARLVGLFSAMEHATGRTGPLITTSANASDISSVRGIRCPAAGPSDSRVT